MELLLPAALNVAVAQLIAPALNALLARTSDPEAAIGGFAVAFGITGLVALPQLRIQHLTLVFFDGRASVPALHRFVGALALIVTGVAAVVALTPLSGFVLGRLFGTEGAVREEAAVSLVALAPLPALMLVRMHYYGMALRSEAPLVVWAGTAGGAAAVLLSAALLLVAGLDGAEVAAIAVTTGAAVEVCGLVAVGRRLQLRVPAGGGAPGQRELLAFFTPLLFVAFLPAVSTPLIMAAVARAPEADASLAAFPLAMSIFTLVTLIASGVQPTTLSLLARGDDPRSVRRFAVTVGLVAMIGALVVAWVPPVTSLVVEDLLGARGRLAELTATGLRVLSFLPLLLTVEQLYAAALLQARRTKALVYVNAWRLLGLLLFVGLVPMATGWSGVLVGAGAITFTLALEAVAAVAYGRAALAQLIVGAGPLPRTPGA